MSDPVFMTFLRKTISHISRHAGISPYLRLHYSLLYFFFFCRDIRLFEKRNKMGKQRMNFILFFTSKTKGKKYLSSKLIRKEKKIYCLKVLIAIASWFIIKKLLKGFLTKDWRSGGVQFVSLVFKL